VKAVVCTRYGPPEVLQLREVEEPAPKDNEVRAKIHATTVTSSDGFIRSGFRTLPFGYRIMGRLVVGVAKPRNPILGLALAGEVEAAGRDVARFRAGDRVYAFTKFRFGSYAEYTCLPEDGVLAPMPSNVTYEEAAAVPFGGLLALHFLRKGDIRSGQKVLIYGASGAVGTSAVQFARHFGAEVTGVCSTANVDMVRSLGAGKVMDYTKEDLVRGGERYDLILDAVGKSKSSRLKARCKKSTIPEREIRVGR
jgi:NADPH:quinone reductase-like Zn-dependent oxidoreductase